MSHGGKMINEELASLGRKRKALAKKVQATYGIVKDEAKRQMNDFKLVVERLRKSMSGPK